MIILCHSQGVEALIEEIKVRLMAKLPTPTGKVGGQVSFISVNNRHHTQYDTFELAEFSNGERNPSWSISYGDGGLRVEAKVVYRRVTKREEGFLIGEIGGYFPAKESHDLTWVEEIPLDFKVIGQGSSVLVTSQELAMITKALEEGAASRNLVEEDNLKLQAEEELGRRPLEY